MYVCLQLHIIFSQNGGLLKLQLMIEKINSKFFIKKKLKYNKKLLRFTVSSRVVELRFSLVDNVSVKL